MIRAVLFDLGGVLLDISQWAAMMHLPWWCLVQRLVAEWKSLGALQRDFFALLDRWEDCEEARRFQPVTMSSAQANHPSAVSAPAPTAAAREVIAPSCEGIQIPWILAYWMVDGCPSAELLASVLRFIDDEDHHHHHQEEEQGVTGGTGSGAIGDWLRWCLCFAPCLPGAATTRTHATPSAATRELMKCIARITLDPQALASVMKPVAQGIQLLRDVRQHAWTIDSDVRVYLLSNFNSEAFAWVRRRNPELMDLFDGILVSGEVHRLKPWPEIYQHALKRWNLQPEDCLFLDDALENVQAARRLGIPSFVFDRKNTTPIREYLRTEGLLPP